MMRRLAIALLAAAALGCGAESDPVENGREIGEPSLEDLRDRYEKEAEAEINADNARQIADELQRELDADEER